LLYRLIREYRKWLIVIGIILLVVGFSLSAYAYEKDRNCFSINEQINNFYTFGSGKACLPYLYWIVVGAIVSISGIILAFTTFRGNRPIPQIDQSSRGFFPIIAVTLGGLIIIILFTESLQYVPISDREEDSDPNNSLSVRLIRDSTILIPFRSVLSNFPVHRDITAVIDFQTPVTNITNVKLVGPSNSILTYHGDFNNTSYHGAKDKNSQTLGQSTWVFQVSALHNMEVDNTTSVYNLIISYINQSSWKSNHVSVPFSWPIKTLNLSTLTYFWIVVIGVVVSKLSSEFLSSKNQGQPPQGQPPQDKNPLLRLVLGIAFSAIIALLIFANFERDIKMTGNILVNISLAFGFGFGFDKVLEAGQRILGNQS